MALALQAPASAQERLNIEIEGIDGELLSNVKSTLSIVQIEKGTPSSQLTEAVIKRSYAQSKKQIRQALRPFGFYQALIRSQLKQDGNVWTATFNINSGPATLIRKLSIQLNGTGAQETVIQEQLARPGIQQGDVLQHQSYEELKQRLYDTLFNIGYIDAQYQTSEIRVDIKNNLADIILVLDSGLQYYFGDINIKQRVINPKKLQRIVNINRDTPFNSERLIGLQLRLSDTGYFANTNIQIEREKTLKQRIPVTITTTPSKKLKYSTSLGFGTDTGARAGFSILNRRVNKEGHRFQFSTQVSEIESNVATQYSIPIGNINSEYVDIFANANQEVVNDVDATQYTVGSSINQNRWSGRRRISLTILQEQFSFDGESNQTANLLIPGMSYNYKKADNPLFSRRGYSFSSDFHGGIESEISETSFFHSHLSARSVFPLGAKARLLNRLELGAIVSDEFEELPPSERFFTGGAQSVRGYDYKDIGPRNEFNNNIGGEYLVAGSIELDYLAWGNIGFALFYDAGDVADNSNFSLKTAAGLGFRYRSAIGMIRLDLAHPFDDPDEDFRFHISIGPDL